MKKGFLVVALLVSALFTFAQESTAEFLNTSERTDFWRENGWSYTAEAKPGLEGIQWSELTMINGAKAPDAASFDPQTFDPSLYNIQLDEVRPTNILLGDYGVIQFHSKQRFDVLYDRYVTNKKN